MERVLKSGLVKVLILFTIFVGFAQSILATTVIMPSDDNMIIEARAIVRGKVLSVGSALDEQQNRIFTYTTLRVQEVLKGQISERKIVIKEEGGQVGMRGTRIFGTPEFKVDESVLLYLDTWADGSLRVHQFFLGKFSIIDDPATGKTMAVRSSADEDVVVVGNLPQSDQPKGNITDRMELSAYTELVRARLAANLQTSQAFEERYYSGASLLTRPPEFASKAKRGEIQPQYVFLAPSTPPRWFEIDSGQAVSFFVNPAGAFTPNYVTDVQSAMNAWSTISGSALRVVYGGPTDQCSPSGFNTIIFNGCDGQWAPSSSCQGILALGGCSWFGNTKVVNGTTFYQATGGFVTMNPNASCFFAGQDCNTSEVLTHEMGHALGLGHSLDPTATMYAIAHFDGRCAKAMPDDQAAMVFIYPGSGGGPGPLAITTTSLPAATTGTVYNQALACSGGTPGYTWSLVAGQGSLPTGLSLSNGGIISGTLGATGTFNFTVKVTDSAAPAASVQKALSIVVSATGGLALDSQFVTQTVPASVTPGQSFPVDLKFLNTGTQSWSGAANFYLVSQNPSLNQTWGGNGVSLGGNVISSGQQLDAAFTVTAPSTPGNYNFQWQMYKNDGTGFFGQMSTNVSIAVGTQTNLQGFHDAAGCNTISGWAWDANNPNGTVNVDIYDGSTLISTTAANMYREDLLNALGSPNHGFSFNTPASLRNGAVHTITVKFSGTSVALTNTSRTIQCSSSPNYWGRHDGQGCNAIEGWAWDSTDPNGTVNVDIYDGSTLIATVAATLYRQDLADSMGSPYHGFIFHTPASLKDGLPHTITIKFGGTNTNLPLDTPRTASCTSGTPNYQGVLNLADCNSISGYAWDANDDQGTINAAIYVDGSFYVVVPAQQAFAGVGTGFHGFKFAVPASLKNSQTHSITVMFSGTTTTLQNSARSLLCP